MGRKTEMEVVTVMMKLCYCQLRPSTARCIPLSQLLQKGGRAVNTYNDIKANIQILGSRAGTYNALHDEDPPPSGLAADAVHLHKAIGQYSRERIGNAAKDVKRGESLANVVCKGWSG
ncbi:MAG: hypothetical protein L6R41_003950 [Letrouitia leprolyta]|nr:MAG: hypothetical protein L6R41_003950 [Letrouitia leprolyta]